MNYELVVTDEATDDLHDLLDSLPASRRRDALDAVDAALERLAANPRLALRENLGRLTYKFSFRADGVGYHWACTFAFSEDETSVRVTHIYRVPL